MARLLKMKKKSVPAKTIPQSAPALSLSAPLVEATMRLQAGDLAEARRLCLEQLQQNPRNPMALNILGMVEFEAGNRTGAENILRRAIAAEPDNVAHFANLGIILHTSGRHDEASAEYLRALAIDPNHLETLNNLGLLLRQTGKLEAARECLERVLKVAPDNLAALNGLGALHHELGELAEARNVLEHAINLRPGFVEALINLGWVCDSQNERALARKYIAEALYRRPSDILALNVMGCIASHEGNLAEARDLLMQALALKPDFFEALCNLGNVADLEGNTAEAYSLHERALSLKPDSALAYNNLGNALLSVGELRPAIERYNKAIALRPDYADAHWNRSLALLVSGNFAQGFPAFEWRLKANIAKTQLFPLPMWKGEALAGRRLLLYAEQGLGDSIHFLRYLPQVLAAGGEVHLALQPQLRRLAELLPGLASITVSGESVPECDLALPLMSLPLACGTTSEATIPSAVPYLSIPDSARATAPAITDSPRLRVGLAWRGSKAHTRDQLRSIALASFAPLFELADVHFYSLQLDANEELPPQLTDLTGGISDMADTAARLDQLDLLISVDTALVHLAGALAIPVWTLIPFAPDWRWQRDRSDSPWYPTMRLFRQPEVADWATPIEQIRCELTAILSGDRQRLLPPQKSHTGTDEATIAEAVTETIDEATRRQQTIVAGETDLKRWSDPGQLEVAWDARARFAAEFISEGTRVLDLGCGRMSLEGFLPWGCSYQPCDLVARDIRTILCDFNHGNYPDEAAHKADLVSMLGVLEYIFEPSSFFAHLHRWQRPLLLSYCATEGISATEKRRSLGWVNDLSLEQLLNLFNDSGFAIERAERIDNLQWIFRLQPTPIAQPAPIKRVGVLSYNTCGNFGDRLGYHLLNAILPAHAEVEQLGMKPMASTQESFDLLILGIGNSFYNGYICPELEALVERSKCSIGIFGTQYRQALAGQQLGRILDRLDHWYARYEDDLRCYARGRQNCTHLGDWLISAFPMVRATNPERLNIGIEIRQDLPLDRTIQKIQQHRIVASERIHPLLCALTSAEEVAYREQREDGSGEASGKFRSMFLDIFGRNFPEDQFFPVDRDAVLRYKTKVQANIDDLRQHLAELLAK